MLRTIAPGDLATVGVGHRAGVVGRENFLGPQGLSGDALGKRDLHSLGRTFFRTVANAEYVIFEQCNKAASETQEIRSPNHEGLQELFEIAAAVELGGDLKQLVQFMSLGVRGGIELRVGHRHRPKS